MNKLTPPSRRVLVVAPFAPETPPDPGTPPPGSGTARTLLAALRARPGLVPHLLSVVPPGQPGLSRPAGTVLAGMPGRGDETLLILPLHRSATGLVGSWYLASRLREFLAARAFETVWLLLAPPVGPDFAALIAAALAPPPVLSPVPDPVPPSVLSLALPGFPAGLRPAPHPTPRPVPRLVLVLGPETDAALGAGDAATRLVLPGLLRAADRIAILPGAPEAALPPGLPPPLLLHAADPARLADPGQDRPAAGDAGPLPSARALS